jgi:hypothetical protein
MRQTNLRITLHDRLGSLSPTRLPTCVLIVVEEVFHNLHSGVEQSQYPVRHGLQQSDFLIRTLPKIVTRNRTVGTVTVGRRFLFLRKKGSNFSQPWEERVRASRLSGTFALRDRRRQGAELSSQPIMQAIADYFTERKDRLIADLIIDIQSLFPPAH